MKTITKVKLIIIKFKSFNLILKLDVLTIKPYIKNESKSTYI